MRCHTLKHMGRMMSLFFATSVGFVRCVTYLNLVIQPLPIMVTHRIAALKDPRPCINTQNEGEAEQRFKGLLEACRSGDLELVQRYLQ